MIAISSHHLPEFEGCAATVVLPILVSLRGERERYFGYYLWPDIMAKVGHTSKRVDIATISKV